MSISRRSFLLALGPAGLWPVLARAAGKPLLVGTVETVRGECIARQRGDRRALEPSAQIFLGDVIVTSEGGRAELKLGTSTHIVLGPGTTLRIDKFLVDRGGELELQNGAILFERPSDPPSGPLKITTPVGLIAARGTKLFAGPVQGTFSVFVEHGLVDVRNAAGEVSLTDGLGTEIRSARTPPAMPQPWSAERIALALAAVS